MTAKGQAEVYSPSMRNDAVKAKTGKTWDEWFRVLDRAGAAKLAHKAIAQLLHEKHGVPGWWSQMVTVEYERARGLRAVNQKADGFSVNVTKTLPVALNRLFAAVADMRTRRRWFPAGDFQASSQTKDKSLRGKWNGGPARLEFNFYAKGPEKSQISLQINRLPDAKAVARERAAWKSAMEKLSALLA